ncbi:MAG: DUF2239 family protein [Pseudomonadota bacterium]
MKTDQAVKTFTAFSGTRCLGSGPIETVALLAMPLVQGSPETTVLFFDDDSGREVDLNLRGSEADVLVRLVEQFPAAPVEAEGEYESEAAQEQPAARGRGRPKLGVVAREVTLLPRHWDWLNSRPGSASVALRKLVDEARHAHAERDERQRAQKATFVFISAMAGDLTYFEEASRALFAGERGRFRQFIEAWPTDIRRHAERLAAHAFIDK